MPKQRQMELFNILWDRRMAVAEKYTSVAKLADGKLGKQFHYTANEAWEAMYEKIKSVIDKYTTAEKKALGKAQGHSSSTNAELYKDPDYVGSYVKPMMQLMHKPESRLGYNGKLFRTESKYWWASQGVVTDQQILDLVNKQAIYHLKGFHPTSIYENGTFQNNADPGHITWVIDAPSDTRGAYASTSMGTVPGSAQALSHTAFGHEFEFVLDRDTFLAVTGAHKEGGHWYVQAKLIQPHMVGKTHKDFHKVPEMLKSSSTTAKSGAIADLTEFVTGAHNINDPKWAAQIDALTKDIYYANQTPDIPTLKEEIVSPLQKQIQQEITDLETQLKAEDKLMDTEIMKEQKELLKKIEEGIKKSDEFAKAVKQAWVCYKGM
jgi:hypothetical protein